MEYNTFVVDSNVFIAFYIESDTQHQDALLAMRELASHTLIVHPYVIQEVATVLTYKFGVKSAKKFLEDVITAGNIIIPAVDILTDISHFSSLSKKISFVDATLVNLAQTMNASLFTFDKQIAVLFRKNQSKRR